MDGVSKSRAVRRIRALVNCLIALGLASCGKTDLYLHGHGPGDDDGGADTDSDTGTGEDPTIGCPCPFDRVYDVFGTSSSDVYLLGGEDHLLHFNGQAWSVLGIPGATRVFKGWIAPSGELFVVDVLDGPNTWTSVILRGPASSWDQPWNQNLYTHTKLRTIWGRSASEVYAIGEFWETGMTDEGGLVLRYDGEHWEELLTIEMYPKDIWGTSPANLWIVGAMGYMHFDGETWTEAPDDPDLGTGCKRIWSSGPQNVYITESYLNILTPHCLHYDGSAWSWLSLPLEFKPYAVWGSGADDFFMAGRPLASAPAGSCPAAHWDGQSWTETPCDIPADAENYTFIKLWGSSREDVYAIARWGEWFGLAGGGYDVLHFNGIEWRTLCEGIYLPGWEYEYWS
jgi:hypothetical protein